jgi:hypothetical protein
MNGHIGVGSIYVDTSKQRNDIKEQVKNMMGEDLEKVAISLLKESYNVETMNITRTNGYHGHENELTIHTRDGKKVTITIQK